MTALEIVQSFIGKHFDETPSPLTKWLNPFVMDASIGSVTFEYTIQEEWLNPIGNLHGGISAAIIDDIIGCTLFTFQEQTHFYTTINNVIDYFSTAKKGDKIIAETKIIKKGKQFVNATCDIWNADRTRLIAKGTSNLFKIPKSPK